MPPHFPEVASLVIPVTDQLRRNQLEGELKVALCITQLLMKVISAVRWTNPLDLIAILRSVGVSLEQAAPHQIIAGNIVRRVLCMVRDEIEETASTGQENTNPMLLSMFSLLSTSELSGVQGHLKKQSSDLRSIIIQGIRDLVDEITNVNEGLETMSHDLIHDNEVLLAPTPCSDTVLQFLLKARTKRKFLVLITECFPNDIARAHLFAKRLAENKIEATIVPDSAVYAVMSRVGKVIMGSNVVFANGGLTSSSGVATVVECAKVHKTPVFAVAGLYKLSPLYPFSQHDLVQVGNTGKVLDYKDHELVENVEVVTNYLDSYIPPENIDIYITNVGGFAPSFIYRIVLDNYKAEDNQLL